MTNLETLVGMHILWAGEDIFWHIRPKEPNMLQVIERWIKKYLKQETTK